MNRELSSYAFTQYGADAKLYNGIHDLETKLEESTASLKEHEDEHWCFNSDHRESALLVGIIADRDARIQTLEAALLAIRGMAQPYMGLTELNYVNQLSLIKQKADLAVGARAAIGARP